MASLASNTVNSAHDDIGMANELNLLVQSFQLVFRLAAYLLEKKEAVT